MHAMHERLQKQLEIVIHQSLLEVWTNEVKLWEDDSEKPNPYTPRVKRK